MGTVNGWDDTAKLQWLHVRVTGKAHVALTRTRQETYEGAKGVLRERFDPPSKRELYKFELQCRVKRKTESWGDFGDDLRVLADKAYPELQDEARESLALTRYLDQLKNPQVAFGVRQQRPKTVVEAVRVTIELESYLPKTDDGVTHVVQSVEEQAVASIRANQQSLTGVIGKLVDRIERLENQINQGGRGRGSQLPRGRSDYRQPIVCHKCGQPGHYARGCANKTRSQMPAEPRAPLPIDEVPGHDNNVTSHNTPTLTINNVSNYSVTVDVGGDQVPFLIDTGAAVSLIRGDVWDRIKPCNAPKVEPANTRLVGVDGAPLQVRGSVMVQLVVAGQPFEQKVIIADSLTSQGILGLDFLEANQCVLNLAQGELLTHGKNIPLATQPLKNSVLTQVEIAARETFIIGAMSEMETMGEMQSDCEGTWIMEDKQLKRTQVVVARAIVTPQGGKVPMRLLNPKSEPLTIYKGTRLAIAEPIDPVEIIGSLDKECISQVDPGKDRVPESIMESIPANLTDHEAKQLLTVLTQYAHIFATNSNDLGRTNILSHRIETTGVPIRQGVRRVPLPQREEIRKLIKEMQEKDIIAPSKSPWASPIVLVPKKDGSTRLCVDYRRVNEITHKDAYPIPRVDDTLDTLAGSKWFSTLDLKSGYWQVEVDREHREKTAFCTHEGLFQFNVIPFGLCNAPATFQRLMDIILMGLQWTSCLVYIDNMIIVGKTFDEHLNNVRQVFE